MDRDRGKAEGETGRKPTCNILGPTALGFRHRDDLAEISTLVRRLGIDINVVAPLDARPSDLVRLGAANFNIVLYPEIADTAARWLERTFHQPAVRTVPMGVGATREFISEVARIAHVDPSPALNVPNLRLPWWSQSVDSNYLTGKRVFVFGDATHAIAAARAAREEFAFEVVGLGAYNREFARDVRAAAEALGVEPLITDDYLEVEARIAELQPELVLGTQMERHIAKRLGIPCAVISAPTHVEDFPARYSPVMGFEGANVLFDTWVHPLVMGLEEHLLGMFRDDVEFHDDAGPSHISTGQLTADTTNDQNDRTHASAVQAGGPIWRSDAELELKKIPFFVRGKARRNTERYASDKGLTEVSLETLYDAKAHFAR